MSIVTKILFKQKKQSTKGKDYVLTTLLLDVIGEDDIQKPNDEDYQEWLVCDTCEVIIDPELKTYECNCKLLNNLRQTQRTKLKELFNVEEK